MCIEFERCLSCTAIVISFQFCICVFIFVYLYFVSESIGFERHLSCTAICISSQGASQALGPEVEKYKCNRKVYE